MTLTLVPTEIAAVMASRPSTVAGILIMTFGFWMRSQSFFASAMVAWASCAAVGETSIETRPSKPLLES